MKVKRSHLKTALEITKPGLGKSSDSEQADFYGFTGGRVVTFNDEISMSYPVEGLDLEGAVYAKELHGLLSKLDSEDIEIEHGQRQVVVKSGKAKAGFAIRKLQMPFGEMSEQTDWKDLPDGFVEGLSFAITCTSKDLSKPLFNSVHVNSEGYIEATDNYRIASYDLEEGGIDTFLIPARSARQVVKINPDYYSINEGWIHFKNSLDTILSCRVLSNEFFNTDEFLEVEGIEFTFPEDTSKLLDRAEVFLQDKMFDEQIVEITVRAGAIDVLAESDQSWFEESTDAKYKGKDITFYATPSLLKDIFKTTRVATISTNLDRIAFEGDGWIYVAMLRIKQGG